jgi:hypothetical protein
MSNFLGIKQVLFSEYSIKTQAEKIGYLWLVRNGEGSNSFDIYFGSRKYGSNDLSVISKLHDAFGGFLGADGAFTFPTGVEFTSFNDESVNDFGDVLIALDAAVKANQDALTNVYTKTEVDGLIDGVEALLNGYAKNVTVTVGEATYTGTFADNVVNVDLSDAFEAAGKVKDVTVDGVSVMDGTTAKIDLTGKADVSSVNAISGRVDALELIKHATDVKYDSVSKKINLYAGNAVLGDGFDAAPFLVDGMLKSVEFVKDAEGKNTTTLRFTFNADGEDKVIDVNFADYVDTYHADGTSLELDSTTNTFSVKNVDASKTTLGSSIQIAGGPLANNVVDSVDVWPTGWTDESGNKVIPSGKTMEEILTALFLKVVEGTVSWDDNASWSPSLGKPTVQMSSSTVEVGAKVKVSKLTAGSASAGTRTATCACSQGHFLADANGNPTGNHVAGNKTLSKSGSIEGTASYAWTWNGTSTDVTVNSTELTASNEGANKIKVTQSGQSAVVEALPTTKVFAATNTKAVLTGASATFTDTFTGTTSSGLSRTSDEVTVNAYYPIYTNGKQGSNGVASSETALVANDATKLNLVADGTAFYVNFAPMIDGGTGYRLLVKSGKVITQAMALNTLNSKYEVDMKSSFVKAANSVKKTSGGVEIDYDVYEAKGSAGANAIQFKID